MTNLRLRDKVESNLTKQTIIIACDKTQDVSNKEKAIFFIYEMVWRRWKMLENKNGFKHYKRKFERL